VNVELFDVFRRVASEGPTFVPAGMVSIVLPEISMGLPKARKVSGFHSSVSSGNSDISGSESTDPM